MNFLVNTLYEPRIAGARDQFRASASLATILDSTVARDRLHLFLIHYCALGVSMTEPVDGWIRRAGERCVDEGLRGIGHALIKHARHEAGHHRLMQEDTRTLVGGWNERHAQKLDSEFLLDLSPTEGARAYADLHEAVIAGDTPYAQIAIEYEIEALSVRFGPALLSVCANVLGAEVLHGLSFLSEHVALDVGHTKFNEAELERTLAEDASRVTALVDAGSAALDAYSAFLSDCLSLADETASRLAAA